MTRYLVDDPNGPDVELEGEQVIDDHHHDIGSIRVYRTKEGRWVLRQKHSSRPGKIVIDHLRIFDTVDELVNSLGFSPGAKCIARRLGRAMIRRLG